MCNASQPLQKDGSFRSRSFGGKQHVVLLPCMHPQAHALQLQQAVEQRGRALVAQLQRHELCRSHATLALCKKQFLSSQKAAWQFATDTTEDGLCYGPKAVEAQGHSGASSTGDPLTKPYRTAFTGAKAGADDRHHLLYFLSLLSVPA